MTLSKRLTCGWDPNVTLPGRLITVDKAERAVLIALFPCPD